MRRRLVPFGPIGQDLAINGNRRHAYAPGTLHNETGAVLFVLGLRFEEDRIRLEIVLFRIVFFRLDGLELPAKGIARTDLDAIVFRYRIDICDVDHRELRFGCGVKATQVAHHSTGSIPRVFTGRQAGAEGNHQDAALTRAMTTPRSGVRPKTKRSHDRFLTDCESLYRLPWRPRGRLARSAAAGTYHKSASWR